MRKITSRENPKIKFARQVRDGKEGGLIFLEGVRLAEEILRARLRISDVFFTEDFAKTERGGKFLETTGGKNVNLTEVAENVFAALADTRHSQGVVCIAEKPAQGKEKIEANLSKMKSPLVLLLHEINNPSNAGAILRTAEAANAAGIITTKNSADIFSPKALRGAMGASLRLPCWINANFFEALEWAGDRNLKSVCADARGEKSYTEIDWTRPRLLVVGSEGHGLNEAERAATDESLIIPMHNGVESLNVAVACGVILFEAERQRKMKNENGKLKIEN